MKEKAFEAHLFKNIEFTSSTKAWVAIRKMFTEYLTLLHVPFYDCVCPTNTLMPVSSDTNGVLSYFDPDTETWVLVPGGSGSGDVTDGENLTGAGIGVFTNKVSGKLQFRRIKGTASKISVVTDGDGSI